MYIINLDEYESLGTHWKCWNCKCWNDKFVNAKNLTYFDSFRVKNNLKEIRKFIGNKNIIANIYIIQAYD